MLIFVSTILDWLVQTKVQSYQFFNLLCLFYEGTIGEQLYIFELQTIQVLLYNLIIAKKKTQHTNRHNALFSKSIYNSSYIDK